MTRDVSASVPRKRRILRWLKIIGVIIGGIVVLIMGVNLVLELRIRAELRAIRNAGQPIALADLQSLYPNVPPGENAAELYLKAFSAFAEFPPAIPLLGNDRTNLPARGEPMPDDMKALVSRCLTDKAQALQLLHQAAARKECRYPVDLSQGSSIRLPHLTPLRYGARLLELEALISAENGRPDDAVGAIMASFDLAQSLRREPILISYFVRSAADATAIASIERVLSRTPLKDDHLARFTAALASEKDADAFFRSLLAQRAVCSHIFRNATAQELSDGSWVPKLWVVAYALTGWRRFDYLAYLGVMRDCLAAARLPYPARVQRANELYATLRKRTIGGFPTCPMTWLISPLQPSGIVVAVPLRGGPGFRVDAEHIARIRAAQAGIAIERYRLANAKLPDSLAALVPAFLEAVPQDPFNGKALRYKTLAKGYVVYSVGADLQDNGSREWASNPRGEDDPYDITFTVAR